MTETTPEALWNAWRDYVSEQLIVDSGRDQRRLSHPADANLISQQWANAAHKIRNMSMPPLPRA